MIFSVEIYKSYIQEKVGNGFYYHILCTMSKEGYIKYIKLLIWA